MQEIFEKFKSNPEGLSSEEANKRLEEFGPNKLPESKRLSRIKLLLKQFQNPLIYILLAIILVSFFIKHHVDAVFILFVVLVNGLVGFIQENKSEKALEALQKTIKLKARAIRDSKESEIWARELVPGDIILLRAGDQVPADARLIEANNLKISEASLTGEFWAVPKISKDLVYLGTSVEQGLGKAIIIATGKHTKIGSLALIVKKTQEPKTPLQKKILEFSRILTAAIISMGLLILLIGRDFYTAVALVVSAIPEGLLPVITVVLVVGMRRILKKKGLVRKLVSAETLGSATVICLDKTGTLTTSKMTLTDLIAKNYKIAWQIITKCNEAIVSGDKLIGRPTDKALLSAGLQAGFKQDLDKRKELLPFDAEKKYLAVLYAKKLYISGSPEALLELSEIGEREKEEWDFRVKKLARQGSRLVALAYKKTNNINNIKNLKFIGLAVIKDPLRPDVKKAIKICQKAGIRPIIVTGDHKLTAKTIAQEIGLDVSVGKIIDGSNFNYKDIREINVFSRVTPEQKLQIINAWQEQGEIVAMTGDGVNDAPALKKADIGISLASGTDTAKQVADLVLLKNNFQTIVAAIEQGRILFENIKKVVLYLLSTDFSEIFLISLSFIFGLPLPLIPVQILWINIIEDTFPDFALALEPGEPEIMQGKVRNRKILDNPIKRLMLIIGLITGLASFGLFVVLMKFSFELGKIRTMIFAVETVSSLLFVFSCRSLHHSMWRKDIFSNQWLNIAVIIGLLLLLTAVYLPLMQTVLRTMPLSASDWSIILITSILDIILIELFKYKFVIKDQRG